MGQVRKDILNGWKEIASYVGRDIRTVERWEKQRGLPIRRVPGAGRATVYALVSELDEWFASARSLDGEDSAEQLAGGAPAPVGDRVESTPAGSETATGIAGEEAAGQSGIGTKPRWRLTALAAGAVLVVAIAGWIATHREHSGLTEGVAASGGGSAKYSFDASRTTPGVPYPSQVAGVDELYLRGIYSYEQRTPESLKHSQQYFSEAIAKDPNYAPAYAGLSNTYNLMREYSVMGDAVAYPKAKAAAERAVALDPKLPQAHASLGFIDFFWSADAVGAEREFHRALELDPAQVLAHHWYGSVLTHEGRYDEALVQLNLAQRLQPTSAAILSSRALALGLDGHRDEAVDMMQELLNEAPGATSPHQILAILSLVEPRDIARWLDETRRIAQMRNDSEEMQLVAVAEPAYRSGGETAMWEAIKKHDEMTHPAPSLPSYGVGAAEAALGHNDAAFAVLAPLVKRHEPGAMVIAMDPLLADLRKDPRYGQMLAETGIPAAMQVH